MARATLTDLTTLRTAQKQRDIQEALLQEQQRTNSLLSELIRLAQRGERPPSP